MGRTPTKSGQRTICGKNSLKEAWSATTRTMEQAAGPNQERNKWTAYRGNSQLAKRSCRLDLALGLDDPLDKH